MKICKLFIDKAFLAEKLGIDESQFAIGEVESNNAEITFTVFIDENAETKMEARTAKIKNDGLNLVRRARLD